PSSTLKTTVTCGKKQEMLSDEKYGSVSKTSRYVPFETGRSTRKNGFTRPSVSVQAWLNSVQLSSVFCTSRQTATPLAGAPLEVSSTWVEMVLMSGCSLPTDHPLVSNLFSRSAVILFCSAAAMGSSSTGSCSRRSRKAESISPEVLPVAQI